MKTHLLSLSPAKFCKATKACSDGAEFAAKHATMAKVWDACQRVDWLVWMLNAIDAPQDEKTCRLFMVWCARNTPLSDGRTTGDLLTDPRSLAALEVAERFANGNATQDELSVAELVAKSVAKSVAESVAWSVARSVAESVAWSVAWSVARSVAESVAWSVAELVARSVARSAQAAQFRKMVANPFKA